MAVWVIALIFYLYVRITKTLDLGPYLAYGIFVLIVEIMGATATALYGINLILNPVPPGAPVRPSSPVFLQAQAVGAAVNSNHLIHTCIQSCSWLHLLILSVAPCTHTEDYKMHPETPVKAVKGASAGKGKKGKKKHWWSRKQKGKGGSDSDSDFDAENPEKVLPTHHRVQREQL